MKKALLSITILLFILCAHAQPEAQTAFSEGVKLLKANKFTEAEKQFSKAIEKWTVKEGLKMSWIYKGFSLNGQLKYNEAIRCFDKAIELDPQDAASYTDRGLAYSYKKEYDKAILDFRRVLKIEAIT
ncbi:MAG: tetratricopeptide repeat protein [Bacteroidota bacterium]